MSTLETTLTALEKEVRGWMDREHGNYVDLRAEVAALSQKYACRDMGGFGSGRKSGMDGLVETFRDNLDMLRKSGRLMIEVPSLLPQWDTKAVVTSSGITTPLDMATVAEGGRYPYQVRRLFQTIPTEASSVFFIRENVATLNASPAAENTAKQESTFTFTPKTVPIETVAHFVNVSRQAFDDLPGLVQYLNGSLLYGLEAEVESQILAGDGVSPSLEGIVQGATAFDTSLLPPPADGWEYYSCLHAAKGQLQTAGFNCMAFVVNPTDWQIMEATRDSEGRYVLGNPRSEAPMMLWSVPVVTSPVLSVGSFLALDTSRFHIRQRMRATIDVSFEHNSNFTSNLATIRGEERLALVAMRPDAAVYGSFSQSPA